MSTVFSQAASILIKVELEELPYDERPIPLNQDRNGGAFFLLLQLIYKSRNTNKSENKSAVNRNVTAALSHIAFSLLSYMRGFAFL